MQIFAKVNGGKILTLDVTADDTVRQLVVMAWNKAFPNLALPADERIKVAYLNKSLVLDLKLEHYNLQKETTFNIMILPAQDSVVDQEVLGALQRFLYVAAAQANANEITFIGVGSYDNGHGSLASVKRQQCPDTLLTYCIEHQVDLNIILIDPGYGTESHLPPQIYHSGEWALLHRELGGKMRQYKHQPAVALKACDIWLTTFATGIAEYGADLMRQGTVIAAVHLPDTFGHIVRWPGCCLICGNFYASPTDPSQFFTLGDDKTIKATGFDVNPPH
ncbi:hypothetical protein KVG96_08165 [Pseudomonas sp. COR58]|uniref:Ubiquitin-like domain-containing protein n=1 Tax=Pseudomonas ekonensis TaxID=2842353 RepID=A0ABS6PD22_9PSED|nr:hypothetical protein [Pseudomonas ekonensis]MBV4457916.1 hypothetical protein [Pseudomonas ekonensis]